MFDGGKEFPEHGGFGDMTPPGLGEYIMLIPVGDDIVLMELRLLPGPCGDIIVPC